MSGYMPSVETVVKGAVASAVGFSTLSLGLLYYGQNYLIYPSAFPPGSRSKVPVPTEFGLPYEDVVLATTDEVKVRAYLLLQRKDIEHGAAIPVPDGASNAEIAASRPTVMMFHGNGGNAGHRIPLAKMFYARMRCNVLMLSYRGYGLSEGSPSEKGIRMDAQAALDFIKSHPVLRDSPVILYGQSIGGAVAIDLASRNPSQIHALILENTFLSLPRLIPSAMPLLARVAFLCHQKWDSAAKVPLLPPRMPVLMLSGARDEIVPREHMLELERLVRQTRVEDQKEAKRPGWFVNLEAGAHNDTCVQPGYWQAVFEFLRSME